MRLLITIFLVLCLMFIFSGLMSCAHVPKEPPRFVGRWQFIEAKPGETMACLRQEDVEKLANELMLCRAKKK
jgi:hypothetical protein